MPKLEEIPVRIATLPALNESDILDGFEFRNCEIIGPAILAILNNNTFITNTFDGDFDALLWEVPISRKMVIGAIGVQNCTFTGCTFRRIGVAGPPEFTSAFRKAVLETPRQDVMTPSEAQPKPQTVL